MTTLATALQDICDKLGVAKSQEEANYQAALQEVKGFSGLTLPDGRWFAVVLDATKAYDRGASKILHVQLHPARSTAHQPWWRMAWSRLFDVKPLDVWELRFDGSKVSVESKRYVQRNCSLSDAYTELSLVAVKVLGEPLGALVLDRLRQAKNPSVAAPAVVQASPVPPVQTVVASSPGAAADVPPSTPTPPLSGSEILLFKRLIAKEPALVHTLNSVLTDVQCMTVAELGQVCGGSSSFNETDYERIKSRLSLLINAYGPGLVVSELIPFTFGGYWKVCPVTHCKPILVYCSAASAGDNVVLMGTNDYGVCGDSYEFTRRQFDLMQPEWLAGDFQVAKGLFNQRHKNPASPQDA